jgi:hypothetical protein
MPYEPAINTTVSPTEKVKYWLDRAVDEAHTQGMTILGFIATERGGTILFEPFSSSRAIKPRQFVELIARAATEMLTEEESRGGSNQA